MEDDDDHDREQVVVQPKPDPLAFLYFHYKWAHHLKDVLKDAFCAAHKDLLQR